MPIVISTCLFASVLQLENSSLIFCLSTAPLIRHVAKWNSTLRDQFEDAKRSGDRDKALQQLRQARPKLSVAVVDYGSLHRVGLEELYELERLAISPGRPYLVAINVSGATAQLGEQPVLQGQVICFPQPEAPQQVAEVTRLPRTDVLQLLVLNFLGPRRQFERWSRRQRAVLLATRLPLIFDTLRVLKAVHPAYALVEIDESAATQRFFSGSLDDPDSLVSRASDLWRVIDDPQICNVDVFSRSADPAQAMPQVCLKHIPPICCFHRN